jgi:hypothetical protein
MFTGIMNSFDMEHNLVEEKPTLGGGIQRIYRFPNGWGASVIKDSYSYGGTDGKWELAVLNEDNKLDYTTTITDNVLGYLSDDDVTAILENIRELPPRQNVGL